jgi:PAS domain S-box-containing protein
MVNVQATDGHETEDPSDPIQLPSSNLSAFLEISPDALILIDQAGIIVMINQQAEALFGYPRTYLLYQPLEQLLPERFWDSHREHRMSRTRAPVFMEREFSRSCHRVLLQRSASPPGHTS